MFDNKKRVYRFGGKTAEGDGHMRELLGGKGANLAEMSKLGMPVPAGFTITTECCAEYYSLGGGYTEELKRDVAEAMKATETIMGKKFGDPSDPLLVSCRSGARSSMPGMMDTILNIGLCSETIPGMIQKTGNPRFVYDAYRRLIMMYSDVVMEKAEGIEPEDGQGIRQQLDRMMMDLKEAKGYKSDTDITAEELKDLCEKFKAKVKDVLGVEFPDTAQDQLWGSIGGVFKSWNGKRAIAYRRIEKIPDDWGTAVNVQSMVFGNMGNTSATGVAFSRNPANGDNKFYGEWLINAQGEDVVAGIRTPNPLNEATKTEKNKDLESLECAMPEVYKELDGIRLALEKHFQDMQDIEFTIQEGHLWMLQCRIGKRTGLAALQMAMDMVEEKMIDEKTAVMRVSPAQLDEILHPILDPASEKKAKVLAMGLPASPGGAVGQIVFTSEAAMEAAAGNRKAILIREETSPEDIEGMRAAAGILTTRGGMTSHAALVARGWGKCCIVGCESMKINFAQKTVSFGDIVLKEGDWMSLNGTKGLVYGEQIATMDASENPLFVKFMATVDKFRKLGVRTNADTPEDAKKALSFGAEGIGLFRIEHMFYGANSELPLAKLRKMILCDTDEERKSALAELEPFIKAAVKSTMKIMDGKPVVFRLLDPPLHEFVPKSEDKKEELANELGVSVSEIEKRGEALHEVNPMMGHRGVRLHMSYPLIAETQYRAIFTATAELINEGLNPHPEIMIPVTISARELSFQKAICERVKAEVEGTTRQFITYQFGTMIEIPRAALTADRMARAAEFFSFGTNDLTQMTFGFSRDDVGTFMGEYLGNKILDADPFQTIDTKSVGKLVETGIQGGRSKRPDLKCGVCGEHGGDPDSIKFFNQIGVDYVSCSPFRVPIARLAAAQAAIQQSK
ncbi:MAG: pyruvate, phosphate dikinase [Bacteroidales bacterium]|uniref:pyruvate, phosphate dikinase n=1 Tax=Candidatus Cryptobacteroides sp. TaxID=2952915 RepID=UPI002A75DEFC|nr:pyruvate, phosphate dikinase [Candidatus Cryptobacteroides sp.]MBS7278017.1 pyruvate, phosphate dikinase [Bacteroidales bacterium]MCI6526991.1 pyruvate, phosphate dikinase [Bacteroidales bacterium]MDD5915325.1 pyruvate, phosphate dikinase [Bacteroidales bacterium]MDD7235541.1 pyruvate, phosphate dikinase [Bacteroidales bacterium]MDD7623439.1 pyruvate, phosphate dikinase [Bacteroidales bacterium]